jgi:hypothetical protein
VERCSEIYYGSRNFLVTLDVLCIDDLWIGHAKKI